MRVIPCEQNQELNQKIEQFAEVLRTRAHTLGEHGLSETDFYENGLFRGVIERLRGQFAATMREKRVFVQHVLEYMQDKGFITEWAAAGDSNRHDYTAKLTSGRLAGIELKGCLDGNNTNIFERPAHVEEFVIWSVCSNAGANPQHNVWSGIHTRLSAEIIEHEKQVDGLIVWDWLCGTIGRPCPKLLNKQEGDPPRTTTVAHYQLPPPCIYLFPKTVPTVRNNPNPDPHELSEVHFLKALHECFGGKDEELNKVRFLVSHRGTDTVRATMIERNGVVQRASDQTPIRRR